MFMTSVAVRLASSTDSKDVFVWRNDADTLLQSHNTNKIEWQDHSEWFNASLSDGSRVLLIAFHEPCPDSKIGIVRFDIKDGYALVSINIAPAMRGKRLAQPSLLSAIQYLVDSRVSIEKIRAEVKTSNIASTRVFEAAGFLLNEVNDDIAIFDLAVGVEH